ncbi:MAG TPA: ATP synthase F0 subunit B [Thermodesulfovibrionales bacterium]|nr:ATP synthase F0 subunit B [Thermodesulfovibrionales bacterium]
MLELNKWFFVLLLNFLVLIYILNLVLFKPLLRLFNERDDTVKGALNAAKEMAKKKEDAIALMNRELHNAQTGAKNVHEAMRKEGLEKQKEILEGANKEALQFIDKARTELKTESSNARQRLRSDVEKFSDEIVKKLVG